jgi:hypothetical protein
VYVVKKHMSHMVGSIREDEYLLSLPTGEECRVVLENFFRHGNPVLVIEVDDTRRHQP